MPELIYTGPVPHGHVVYGPVTLKPYRVYPGEAVEVDIRDAGELEKLSGWKKKRAAQPAPDQEKGRADKKDTED